ncbi:hypothetical protein DY000_02034133 [Brassica cretica]|uniref:Uncharacterized protein n=1 Tax=Brassica cretica TaxID=69181 RepID=A0ABQ7DP49_BRACR|nr:hypothetical protein DY000_02034133 [Brassica cretica]
MFTSCSEQLVVDMGNQWKAHPFSMTRKQVMMRILNPPRKLEKKIQHAMSEVESICLKRFMEEDGGEDEVA